MRNSRHLKIAVCNDILEFQGNQLLCEKWAKRFPGADWFRFLFLEAQTLGWEVASGDMALLHIQSGYWTSKNTYVVQELGSSYGKRLIGLGATPLLLTAFESPLYAGPFYDDLPYYVGKFPEIMAPVGGNRELGLIAGNKIWPLRFPCYLLSDKSLEKIPWIKRKKLCLVANNKHWSTRGKSPSIFKPRRFFGWARQNLILKFSKSRKYATQQQLHDKRLNMIEFFSKEKSLDIYGGGWGNYGHLPRKWRKHLEAVTLNDKGPIDSKLTILNQYQFAICFENTSLPGYVTEKIIDCIVAGIIPIYMGAPDIQDYVPRGCYIDAGEFSKLEDLDQFLKKITGEQAARIIEAGEKFLNSPQGQSHSYEYFSKWIINLVKKHATNI
jgi:hypothetical protein